MAREKDLIVLGETGAETQGLWNNSPVVWVAVAYAFSIGLLETLDFLGLHLLGSSSRIDHIERYVGISGDALAKAPLVLFSCFMVFLAYQLWLKKLAALFILSGLLLLQSFVMILRNREILAGMVAFTLSLILIYSYRDFPARPDRANLKKLKFMAPVLTVAFFAYGTIGLLLFHASLGLKANPFTLLSRSIMTVFGDNSGLQFHGGEVLFQYSLVLLALFGIVWMIALIFRPHDSMVKHSEEEHRLARQLTRRYGSDTLSYFNLRWEKSFYFLDDEIFLAYRCIGGTVVITGDPVGPPELVPEIMARFHNYCVERGWRLTCLGAGPQHLPAHEQAGLKSLCCGEEAILHLDEFTLGGRKNKTLRHAVTKWQKAGTTMEFMINASIPSHLKHELAQISADWRGDNPETGSTMGLGRLMNSEDPDCLLAIAYDRDQNPIGFMYLVPVYPRLGYSLDITRISVEAANGLNEFIFARTAQFLKEQGYKYMSLHFATFSQNYRKDREEEGSKAASLLSRALDCILPIISLYEFDRKFQPRWLRRYVLFESWLDAPRLLFAITATESYLKLMRWKKSPGKD